MQTTMQARAPAVTRRGRAQAGHFVPFSGPTPRSCSVQQSAAPFSGQSVQLSVGVVAGRTPVPRGLVQAVQAIKDGETLTRPLRVAVIGGGPSGACCAETLAKGGVETFLIERKLDNCKVWN